MAGLGVAASELVFSTTHTGAHLGEIAKLIAPQGRFALIDHPETPDIKQSKQKSVSIHWEFMFTRPVFGTGDVAEQGRLLIRVAELVDCDALRMTMGEHYGRIEAANLIRAHRDIDAVGFAARSRSKASERALRGPGRDRICCRDR